MGLESLLVLGVAAVGGGFLIVPYMYATRLTDLGFYAKKRQFQKELADKWNLLDMYGLRNTQELALTRVELLSDIEELYKSLTDPDIRREFEEDDGFPKSIDEYINRIREQSDCFRSDPTQTEAFKHFLNDGRTKQWLTNPAYVMSDSEYDKRTSTLGQVLGFYRNVGLMLMEKIRKSRYPWERHAKNYIACEGFRYVE